MVANAMNAGDPNGYYRVLDVAAYASSDEVKLAYRRKAMEFHPDRNEAPDATEQFQRVNEAYAVLGDPEARAQYDAMSIEIVRADSVAGGERPEPIVCSSCGRVTAQPRYIIFYKVRSFLFAVRRSAHQGIFCAACAEGEALKATAMTWLLGWWGIPWGPVYTLQAIFTNMVGGRQAPSINARLAAHQAWAFAAMGKPGVARAIAFDALALSRKIKPGLGNLIRKKLGFSVADDDAGIRAQVESILQALGDNIGDARLKDAWRLLRRPFYAQALLACVVVSLAGYAIGPDFTMPVPPEAKAVIVAKLAQVPQKSDYVRPRLAPNGKPWPLVACYIRSLPFSSADGLSRISVDNGQNDSDVFAKLLSLEGPSPTAVREFYIPAHGDFTLYSVKPGNYEVRYRDLDTGALAHTSQIFLEEKSTRRTTQYSRYTLTLHKVPNGDRQTHSLWENEF